MADRRERKFLVLSPALQVIGSSSVDDLPGGGKGVANNGGGNDECVVAVECNGGSEVIEPGGGVGRVIVFVAGDNCELLVLKGNRMRTDENRLKF